VNYFSKTYAILINVIIYKNLEFFYFKNEKLKKSVLSTERHARTHARTDLRRRRDEIFAMLRGRHYKKFGSHCSKFCIPFMERKYMVGTRLDYNYVNYMQATTDKEK
jgi:hypothetical protein